MGSNTQISWCDHTWNPWVGCTKVSPACDGCYAENLMDRRMGRVQWGGPGKGAGTRSRTSPQTWNDPFRWHRKAEASGTRPFVFCASLADIFDNQVPAEWRRDAFDVMRRTPRLVYLLLTKRPGNIVRMCDEAGGLPPNAALGTTCEDKIRADRNLLDLEIARFILRPLFTFGSFEPLLDGIEIPPWLMPGWVITGGETDQGAHKARPTHPDWFRSLRGQCAAAGVPFHHKQWGEWHTAAYLMTTGAPVFRQFATFDQWVSKASTWVNGGICLDSRGRQLRIGGDFMAARDEGTFPVTIMHKVGKRAAGRLLDGVLHDARPAVPAMGGANG